VRVPMRGTGTDQLAVVKKSRNGDGAKGLDRSALSGGQLRVTEEEPLGKAKPFRISKRVVWEAFQWVRANKGAAGVDGESIEEFEKDLKRNLYKLWNRMSSGSYFPPPVRVVEIPKDGGGKRALGIPTVTDRVAQMVVKRYLEPLVEPYFHEDSYGYRPGKSAVQAVGVARKRCWQSDWVLDVDIKGFFDNLDHALVMRALRKHTDCRWILLYIERWLKAPAQAADGTLVTRSKGTPQGGVMTPPTQ
jgi:RNA-directed DNA polymerase